MTVMNFVRFCIHHPDGRLEELTTESTQVLIGCGAHCDIRLSVEEARVEHVLLLITPAGLRATARSLDPPPKLDGADFTEVAIRRDAVLLIEHTRIEVSPSSTPAHEAVRSHRGRTHARRYAIVAMGVFACAILIAARVRPEESMAEPKAVPPLWSGTPPACPQPSAEQAAAVAGERLSLALAKEERSPFHPEDGVAAVPLYRVAEACFQVASDRSAADEARASADRVKRQMEEQFRAHRLRLQRSLALQHRRVALRESRILMSFLSSGEGEYVTWLSNLRRKLQLSEGSSEGR
jgi:hypothetical protein